MLLVARSFKRQAFRVGVKPFYSQPERCYRTLFRRSAAHPSRILRISAAGGGALTATLMLYWVDSLYADVPSPLKEPTPTPLSKLLTSYVVYSACSIPGLVEASPALLTLCASIPGLRQLTEAFVRATFFNQVCSFVCMWMR
jgi:proline dehydrogenase